MRSFWSRVSLLCMIFVIGAAIPRASAQFETASVVGTVKDASGATVPDAKVTLTNTETGVSVIRTTSSDGNYEFANVRPGIYIVTAEKPGFSIALMDNVPVQVAARMRVDLQLAVGQLTEKVMVTAASPLVETDTSQRSQVISGEQMRELALNGREYSALALLSTGVRQSALNKSTNGTPREGAFNVNGLRSTFNNFLIDGVDNNAYGTSNQGFSNQVMQPPPDAVSEFRVVTNNQSAEYGRAAGATVNVAYRSGTNQFHGDVWEFFRDTALNAETYFKPADNSKPTLRRNQYGGTVGGPLVKNKAFFFGDFEGFRQDRTVTAFSTLPTALQNSGILSVDVRDPRTGVTYPAGTPIPMTAFARKVLGGLPAPNVAGAANNYSIAAAVHQRHRQGRRQGRCAGQPGAVDVRPLRLAQSQHQRSAADSAALGRRRQRQHLHPQQAAGARRDLHRQREVAARSALRLVEHEGGKNPPALGASDNFGISGLPTDPRIAGGLPSQSITGYCAFGRQATNPQWQYPTVLNPKINYSWLKGRQSLKAGYEFQHINVEVQDVNPLYGLDSYTGKFTKPVSTLPNNNLYNLADFMLGLRSQYALSTFLVANMQQDLHFTYVQDDIRVNDKLTINLGLRYEYATPMWEKNNVLTNFDPTTNTMITAKDGSIYDRALVDPDRNNFGPRLGFAYTPMDKTVVRGGWGLSYVHVNRIGSANLLGINGPQVVRAAVNQSPTAAGFVPTEAGYPAGLTDPTQFNPLTALISYIPRDFHSSPVQSWHLSVQREFGPHMLVDLAYVGNKATDLMLVANLNQAAPNNAAGTIPLAARRPIPTWGDITYNFNGGKSAYNAFQMKYEWRMGADLNILSSLTLSKAEDNAAGSLENQNGNFPAPQDIHNLDADYGLSGYHQPYNSTTSFVWSLPFGHGKRWGSGMSTALDLIAGGWQLAGINTHHAGRDGDVRLHAGGGVPGVGHHQRLLGCEQLPAEHHLRPVVPPARRSRSGSTRTASCCRRTRASRSATRRATTCAGRTSGSWTSPRRRTSRSAPAPGCNSASRRSICFNRDNFTAPNGNRSSAAFGTITSTFDARQVQLGFKLLW